MPLVEYDASSSDDDEDSNDDGGVAARRRVQRTPPLPAAAAATAANAPPGLAPSAPSPAPQAPPIPHPDLRKRGPVTSLPVQTEITSHMPSPSIELPDAALLLSSPFSTHQIGVSDHSSRVAAAMAENASRKRASNGSAPQHPQIKHHKGSSPLSKAMPDVKGSLLIPPQLQGRSNVVTEDITKLFVNRRTDPRH